MASLQQRGDIYYIVFSRRISGKLYQKKFSLGTSDLKKAKNLKYDFEKQYELGRIDPFNGWTPKQEREKSQNEAKKQSFITLKDLSNKFIKERTQANQTTKKNYRTHLNMLKEKVGTTMPVTMISESDIREICFQSNLRTATQASYLRHFKVFFKWLKDNDHVKVDITDNIKPPKVNDKISDRTVTETDLESIFSAYRHDILEKKKKRNITTEAQSRVWFRPVVMTAFYAGLRRKEIINLEWQHVNFDERTLTITESKSGKERKVPIRSKLFNVLKAWHRKESKPKSGLVFPSRKAFTENIKMSGRNITRVFKYYTRKANLSEGVNFHGLRHSCGTELMRLGFDINEVAKILGHSSIEVTRIYEHLTTKDMTDKMEKLESKKEDEGQKSKEELINEIQSLRSQIKVLKKD